MSDSDETESEDYGSLPVDYGISDSDMDATHHYSKDYNKKVTPQTKSKSGGQQDKQTKTKTKGFSMPAGSGSLNAGMASPDSVPKLDLIRVTPPGPGVKGGLQPQPSPDAVLPSQAIINAKRAAAKYVRRVLHA